MFFVYSKYLRTPLPAASPLSKREGRTIHINFVEICEMKLMHFCLIIFIFIIHASFMKEEKKHTMLCLGDSYTIGEAVEEQERFPMQAVELLKKDGDRKSVV